MPEKSLLGPYYLAGYELEAPLINGAGSINGVSEKNIFRQVQELANTGIGAIRIGSITIPRREDIGIWEEDGLETYNYKGLPNIGEEAALKLLPTLLGVAHEKGKPLIVSVTPVHDIKFGSSVDQAKRLVYEFIEAGADLVEFNSACPHLGKKAHEDVPIMGYSTETIEELTEELEADLGANQSIGLKLPAEIKYHHRTLGIKIPRYLTREMQGEWQSEVVRIIRARRVFSYLVVSNTIPNQKVINGYNASLSGSSERVKIIARQQLNDLTLDLTQAGSDEAGSQSIDVVSEQGVDTGAEMAYRLRIGATAVGGVSFLERSAGRMDAVTKMLGEFASHLEPAA